MKKILITCLALAGLATLISSCEKNNPAVNSDLVSVFFGIKNGNNIHFGDEYAPTYDSKGRFAKISCKGYSEFVNPDGPSSTAEDTFTYDEAKRKASISEKWKSYDEGSKKLKDQPSRSFTMTFDEDWKVLTCNYQDADLVFTYDGDYLATARNTNYEKADKATWEDGDLVRYDYSGGSHYEITYGTEKNELGIDFTLDFINTIYALGLAGKHSAHLPVSIKQVFSADSVINYKFTYEKDSKGRITRVLCHMLDDNGNPEQNHVRVTEYKYK